MNDIFIYISIIMYIGLLHDVVFSVMSQKPTHKRMKKQMNKSINQQVDS